VNFIFLGSNISNYEFGFWTERSGFGSVRKSNSPGSITNLLYITRTTRTRVEKGFFRNPMFKNEKWVDPRDPCLPPFPSINYAGQLYNVPDICFMRTNNLTTFWISKRYSGRGGRQTSTKQLSSETIAFLLNRA